MSTTTGRQSYDRELIQQLLEDIDVIDEQFLGNLPKPPTTRAIFAPILRRWIAESLFFKAQRLILPLQVNFPIVANAHEIKLCEAGIYEHWIGLVYFGKIGVATSRIAKNYIGPDGKPTMPFSNNAEHVGLQKVSIFFDQKMFFWKGEFYTRADVIKMHANSLRRRSS